MRVVINELESSPPARLIKEILLARINIGLLILTRNVRSPIQSSTTKKSINQLLGTSVELMIEYIIRLRLLRYCLHI